MVWQEQCVLNRPGNGCRDDANGRIVDVMRAAFISTLYRLASCLSLSLYLPYSLLPSCSYFFFSLSPLPLLSSASLVSI